MIRHLPGLLAALAVCVLLAFARCDGADAARDALRDDRERAMVTQQLAQRKRLDSLAKATRRDSVRLVVTRWRVDRVLDSVTVVMPPDTVPVVPRDVVDSVLAVERAACDSLTASLRREVAGLRTLDSLSGVRLALVKATQPTRWDRARGAAKWAALGAGAAALYVVSRQ